jgi:hypothetical protein
MAARTVVRPRMGAKARRLQIRVPQRLRDEGDGCALIDSVAGMGVSQPVRGDSISDLSRLTDAVLQ